MLATIQIEYGTTATPYEPYGKIWYLNKQIGKSILDGSENWIYSDTYQGIKQFNLLNSDTIYSNDSSVNIISNYYLGIGFSNSWTKDNSITIANPQQSGKRIRIMTSISSTVEDFKTWLSTHNTIVYYALSTPTYEKITDSDLKAQLEQLYKAKSYNNITNITQENDNAPFIIKADALLQISD